MHSPMPLHPATRHGLMSIHAIPLRTTAFCLSCGVSDYFHFILQLSFQLHWLWWCPGRASSQVMLQWPPAFQANSSLRNQRLFSSYKRTTTHLCLRYSCRKTLMPTTSPEATTQAHLMFITINSAKIQRGCSIPTSGLNHP